MASPHGCPHPRTQCAFPEQNGGPADRNLFGDCQFGLNLGAAGLALADETLTAARLKAGSFPTRNDVVQARPALAAGRALPTTTELGWLACRPHTCNQAALSTLSFVHVTAIAAGP